MIPHSFLIICLLCLASVFQGCSNESEGKALQEPVSQPAIAVEIADVVHGAIEEDLDVVGTLEPKFFVEVRSEFAGPVSDIFVTEWVKVAKGDRLARIDTQEADMIIQKSKAAVEAARASVLQAEVSSGRARQDFDRAVQLRDAGLITQQNYDDAEAARKAADASVTAAEAQLNVAREDLRYAEMRMRKSTITAPMDGRVSMRAVNVGDMVSMGTDPMFKIVDNTILNLTLTVPSSRIELLNIGQTIEFTTDAMPGKTFSGQIEHINPAVDSASRTVKIIAAVMNPSEELRAGLFVKGRIISKSSESALLIPRFALSNWNVAERSGSVFIASADTARLTQVRIGRVSADAVEILSGVSETDQVIVRGAFNLMDGSPVRIVQNQIAVSTPGE